MTFDRKHTNRSWLMHLPSEHTNSTLTDSAFKVLNKPYIYIKGIVCAIFLFCNCSLSHAQDTIFTMEGDIILTNDFKLDETYNELSYKKPNLKIKTIDTDEVFSIVQKDGTENILYKYDPAQGNGIEVRDMKSFIMGQAGAKQYHKEPMAFLLGFSAGFAGVFIIPEIGGNLMYSPLIPLATIITVGLTKTNGAKLCRKQYGKEMPSFFCSGYAAKAKNKRMSNTIIGSVAGLVMGAVLYTASGQQ